MSRRKVQGLTRTGRQVSEDPDLEALLSNLSLEELEQLENEVVSAPEPEPETRGEEARRGEEPRQTAANNNNNIRDAKLESRERDTRRLSQRERSLEGEPKKESRKQEYLRKMGLSQEGTDGGLQRSSSVSGERDEDSSRGQDRPTEDRGQDRPTEDRGQDRPTEDRGQDRSTEDRAPGPSRHRTRDAKDNGATTADTKEREKTNEDAKMTKDRRENRESAGQSSKTKDMISRLQKSDDVREKERKEERKEDYKKTRDDGKTKGLISKLQEKKEKDGSKEKDRKEDVRTRGRVSKMLEKQNQEVKEVKAEDKKSKAEQKDHDVDGQRERQKSPDASKRDAQVERESSKRDVQVERDSSKDKAGEKEEEEEEEERDKEKEKEVEKEIKRKDQTREKERKSVGEKESEERKGKGSNVDGPESPPRREGQGNCVAAKEEDEEEEEDSSMFDELMEQVSGDDPALTELNVNNSEVIRTKTLIRFAEALRGNHHVKALAFANCRADDHVAYAVAATLRQNTTLASVNLDSNHLTGKGIIALIHALQHNDRLAELRFHNQRHICGGKTEMEMTKALKDNRTLLKLGYHFELAGPRMTMTNILSRNMDRQRQRRLQEQRQAQANGGDKKGAALEVPKTGAGGSLRGSPMPSPKQSPRHSPMPSPKLTPKRTSVGGPPPPPPPPPGAGPPPPPPPPPPAPMLDMDSLKNSLTPVSRRKTEGKAAGRAGARDQLLASIRDSTTMTLKKVPVPKLLQ